MNVVSIVKEPYHILYLEIFVRVFSSRIAVKDMFAILKIQDLGMIYLYQ